MTKTSFYSTHNTRYSDSSQYDEVCKDCNLTDNLHAKQNLDNTPCTRALSSDDLIDYVGNIFPTPDGFGKKLLLVSQEDAQAATLEAVRAALEWAASVQCRSIFDGQVTHSIPEQVKKKIRAAADDPATVAEIIERAGK